VRTIKAAAILLLIPLLGVLIACVFSAIALPADPNFVRNGGHGSPGDGFLIVGFAFSSLAFSVPLAIFLAVRILRRKPATHQQ
jgi:hypothetical protein